jgi:hypothetical protein
MTDGTQETLLRRIAAAVEEAQPGVRARPEWKDLDVFHRGLDGQGAQTALNDDQVREAEAKLDLLALARAEVEHALLVEHEGRAARLAEDERLLACLAEEARVYIGLILLGLIFPPLLLLMPFGVFLVFGALPAVYGFTRMRAVALPTTGRIWIVLQDRADEALSRVRVLHGAAITALLLTGLWAFVEVLSEQLSQR